MTREELQSAIQDFFDEAFHCGKHEISDTSKAIALDCMMDAAERKRTCRSTNADRIRGMDDNELAEFIDRCADCPLDGHCEFVKCKEKEGMQNVLDKQDKG